MKKIIFSFTLILFYFCTNAADVQLDYFWTDINAYLGLVESNNVSWSTVTGKVSQIEFDDTNTVQQVINTELESTKLAITNGVAVNLETDILNLTGVLGGTNYNAAMRWDATNKVVIIVETVE